jgi:hypothetical protein
MVAVMIDSGCNARTCERFEKKLEEGKKKFRLIREGKWSAVRSPKTILVLRSGEQLTTKVTL